MKISRFLFAAFFVAVSLFPASSRSETRSGAFTLSPMIGGIVMEGDQNVDNGVAYSLGVGYNFTEAFALEASLAYAELDEENSNDNVDFWNYRIDVLYHFMTDRRLVPYVAAGIGGYDLDSDTEFMANYGLGLLYFLADDIALRADVRHLAAFNESNLENNLLYTAGLKFQFGGREESVAPVAAEPAPRDSDGDGVNDDIDECPDTPQGATVDSKGCPLDSDGDGVFNGLDSCPDTPKGAVVDARGCPRDSDGDGVYDGLDRCPDTPKRTVVDAKGCPLDGDGDGVFDGLDKCPDTPQGASVDNDGCPLDSDGDGVFDYLDKCPGTQKGVVVDDQGCELKLTLHINFDLNEAVIKPEFKPELEKAAAFIKANSDVPYVLLSGHTDSQGSAEYNQKLSERRAEAVRRELIENYGIDSEKIRSKGYGESRPVADNSTPEGRYQNRRVEVLCCTILPD